MGGKNYTFTEIVHMNINILIEMENHVNFDEAIFQQKTKTTKGHGQIILTHWRHMVSSVAHAMACCQQHQAITQPNTDPSPKLNTSFGGIGMGHNWPT